MGSLVQHSVALASCRTLSCRGLRWTIPTVWWSKLLEFSWTLCWGSFLSLPVFDDSSEWLSDDPWLSALRCLTAGGVTLVFWVPWSCGVHGLRDGVTCLRSGLWSSSVCDRNEDFPSFWWIWFLTFVRGPLPQAGRCVLRPALVPEAVPPSYRLVLRFRAGFLFYGPGLCGGFNRLLLLCIPSGCGHPLGQ